MPPATMDAYRDHGQPRASIEDDLADARETVQRLAASGIDLDAVGDELQREGVDAFIKSFDDLVGTIKKRLASAAA